MISPRVIAHRGSSEAHAENSWDAFEAAVAEGADAIECDVQVTRDGVLVIRHDLAIRGRRVAECTFAEVAAMHAGLVLLEELLDWAASRRIGLLVEVKDPDCAMAVGAMISVSNARDRIVASGFHAPALAGLKSRWPAVRTSLMMGSVVAPEQLIRLATTCGADGIHPCWEGRAPYPHRLLDVAAIALIRGAGLNLTLWHEERESELRALVALAPDAICTNVPAMLRRIVDTCATSGTTKEMAASSQ